jgi:hypothetical protein
VDRIGRVHIEQSSQDLIDKVLDVLVTEFLKLRECCLISSYLARVDDPVQVSFHELGNNVNVVESCLSFWPGHIQNGDDVLMLKKL